MDITFFLFFQSSTTGHTELLLIQTLQKLLDQIEESIKRQPQPQRLLHEIVEEAVEIHTRWQYFDNMILKSLQITSSYTKQAITSNIAQ